jgi:hypothetical protein
MTFILDALRKSELERQRDSAPGLMRTWSWLLSALLSLAVVGLASAWWLRNRDAGIEAAATQSPGPVETATTSAAVPAGAAPAAVSPGGASRTAAVDAASDAATGAATDTAAAAEGPAADSPLSAGEPRPMADLVRAHPELPRYALSFLDYNGADPDSSSAWINGQRYYPGQAVAGGPELVGIRPEGAVLAYRGQSYLLTAR